jgi:hypothetical protein
MRQKEGIPGYELICMRHEETSIKLLIFHNFNLTSVELNPNKEMYHQIFSLFEPYTYIKGIVFILS